MFNKTNFNGRLIKGDLKGAMEYISRFPEKKELYGRYLSVFEKENYPIYETDGFLNDILTAYGKYYREVFYLGAEKEEAAKNLNAYFTDIFNIEDKNTVFDETEEKYVSKAFTNRGFHFLGGTTGGYFGPYIWTDEEPKKYMVELPEGNAEYTVILLDGFISRGWLSFISLGEIGTGGWTDKNGIVNCVKEKYDLRGEDFTVSLLKHEAQHAEDIRKFKGIDSENLEYRAKLTELIYSEKRNLLPVFISQADGSDPANGHAIAAERITAGFEKRLGMKREEFEDISICRVREIARELFEESGKGLILN